MRPREIRHAIEKAVGQARHDARNQGIVGSDKGPPYDPKPLALLLGASDVRSATIPCDGRVVVAQGRTIIEYDSRASFQRQRFTVAHEVAHLLLPTSAGARNRNGLKPVRARGKKKFHDVETLCNMVASEILIPLAEAKTLVAESRRELTNRREPFNLSLAAMQLAERFETSLHVATIRLGDMFSRRRKASFWGAILMDPNQGRRHWKHGMSESCARAITGQVGHHLSGQARRGATPNSGSSFFYEQTHGPELSGRQYDWACTKGGDILAIVF